MLCARYYRILLLQRGGAEASGQVIVENEQRDMWKLYMDENKFADALETCPDSMRKSVYKAQGEICIMATMESHYMRKGICVE